MSAASTTAASVAVFSSERDGSPQILTVIEDIPAHSSSRRRNLQFAGSDAAQASANCGREFHVSLLL